MDAAKLKAATQRTPMVVNLRRFREPLLNVGVGLIVCLGLIQCWLIFKAMHGRATQNDFSVYYLTAKAVEAHQNPYNADFLSEAAKLGFDTGDVPYATDPPTFVLMTAPLAHLSIEGAFWTWSAFNFGCLALSLFLLFGRISELSTRSSLTLTSLAVWFPPVAGHLFFAQSKLPVLLLLVLSIYSMRLRREAWAGFALALACLTRVFPLLFLGYLALQQRWRTLFHTVIWFVIGSIITAALLGVANTLSFQKAAAFLSEHWNTRVQDIALRGFTTRLFWHIFGLHLSSSIELLRRSTILAINLAILLLTIRVTVSRPTGQDVDWSLFTLWTLTALMLSPVVWFHYEVLLLILYAQIASAASQRRASLRALAMAIVSCILITLWVLVGAGYGGPPFTWWQHMLSEFGFLSMLTAYISAYWFAMDELDFSPIPLREMPGEIWRRLAPTG